MDLDRLINNAFNKVLSQDLIETAVENDNAQRLIQYSLDDDYKQHFNTQKLLETAAAKGKLKVIAAIIESQGAIQSPDEYGLNKAMSTAAANGNTDAVKLIGTKLEKEHFTRSLFYAASEGQNETAQTLIDMGAELNEVNNALEVACSCGHYETVQMLIQNGSDVNFNADMALKKAVLHGHNNIARSLVMEHRAEIIDRQFFEQWNPQVFSWEKSRELNDRLQQKHPSKQSKKTKGYSMKI